MCWLIFVFVLFGLLRRNTIFKFPTHIERRNVKSLKPHGMLGHGSYLVVWQLVGCTVLCMWMKHAGQHRQALFILVGLSGIEKAVVYPESWL